MDLSTLQRNLLPCDMSFPFAFISYSSIDKAIVWNDVIELQRRGYNIWIDEANLDKSQSSWRKDALRAIEDYNCALLIFYVSRSSLTSEPCLEELDRTEAEVTQETHLGKVECIAVDAEMIGHVGEFISTVSLEIERCDISSTEKGQKTRILSRFKKKWFLENNEKVRIHPKLELDRIGDYYSDIEKELNRNRREIRLPPDKLMLRMSPEQLYRYVVECIINKKFDGVVDILEAGSSVYAPSALLLAHMYFTGSVAVARNEGRAKDLWDKVEAYISASKWKKHGIDYNELKFYSEAVAYFLAHGEKTSDSDSLIMAGKMWLKKGCQPQAIIALRLSADMGSDKARFFLNKLYSFDEDKVYRYAYHDEASVK